MTDLYAIPIIARGRIIEPGEDAVEYQGRGGATFRTPDPHQHIHDLVLGNPALLGDLQQTPMRDIIAFLAEVGKRLHIDDNSWLQESFALALHAGGLAEPILRGVYDDLPHMFDADAMIALVESTIGIAYLDGWVPSPRPALPRPRGRHAPAPYHGRQRAGGRGADRRARRADQVGRTDQVAVERSADRQCDPADHDRYRRRHPVCKHVAVAYWKGGDEFMDGQIVRTSRIDKITAWGGMSSVKHIQKFLTPGIDLTALNPKFSMSVIGKEALESEAAMDEAAMGIAVIAGFYNQTACANTRLVYVESETDDESLDRLTRLGSKVVAAFRPCPRSSPRPPPSPTRTLPRRWRPSRWKTISTPSKATR